MSEVGGGFVWGREHAWCAAALDVVRAGMDAGRERVSAPRVFAVVAGSVEGPGGRAAVVGAHKALVGQRKRLRDKSLCWVGTKPSLVMQASAPVPVAGSVVGGEPFGLVGYPVSEGSLFGQFLGVQVPPEVAGLVVVAPTYVSLVEVTMAGVPGPADGSPRVVEVHQPAGPGFPFEEDGEAALCAYARSQDGGEGMLAARVVRGAGRSFTVEGGYADLVVGAQERTGLPPAVPGGGHQAASVMLATAFGQAPDGDAALEAARFSVGNLLGRFALFAAVSVLYREAPESRLDEMADPGYGEYLVDGGWAAVVEDQRTGRRFVQDLLTADEAMWTPLAVLPELARERTPRQPDLWESLEAAARQPGSLSDGVRAARVRSTVERVFAVHPHWSEG